MHKILSYLVLGLVIFAAGFVVHKVWFDEPCPICPEPIPCPPRVIELPRDPITEKLPSYRGKQTSKQTMSKRADTATETLPPLVVDSAGGPQGFISEPYTPNPDWELDWGFELPVMQEEQKYLYHRHEGKTGYVENEVYYVGRIDRIESALTCNSVLPTTPIKITDPGLELRAMMGLSFGAFQAPGIGLGLEYRRTGVQAQVFSNLDQTIGTIAVTYKLK